VPCASAAESGSPLRPDPEREPPFPTLRSATSSPMCSARGRTREGSKKAFGSSARAARSVHAPSVEASTSRNSLN
jgi:hypothetical protein